MKYDNSSVRRQDRLLEEENAVALLRQGEYGVLSMCDGGEAYGIPVSYVWDGAESLYIHCAPEGRKLRCVAASPRVSFCVTGRTHVVPERFTTAYESVIAECEAHLGLPEAERMRALELIVAKYAPGLEAVGRKYAEKSFHRTQIIRLDIRTFSGKCCRCFWLFNLVRTRNFLGITRNYLPSLSCRYNCSMYWRIFRKY